MSAKNPLGPGGYLQKRVIEGYSSVALIRHWVVCIERFGDYDATRRILRDAGYAFTEEDFMNNFWGIRFVIPRPTGRGSSKKLNFLLGH